MKGNVQEEMIRQTIGLRKMRKKKIGKLDPS